MFSVNSSFSAFEIRHQVSYINGIFRKLSSVLEVWSHSAQMKSVAERIEMQEHSCLHTEIIYAEVLFCRQMPM
jgi:hypothetical protein